MYTNTIDEKRQLILEKIIDNISLKDYYMAGGTGLSLQCGNRLSYDFDFFVREDFLPSDIERELEEIGNLVVEYSKGKTLHAILDGVNITFLYYPNPIIKELVKDDNIKGLYYADIFDIAIMKIVAISSRGSKKDFFDLYYLCKYKDIDIHEVINCLDNKYIDKNIPKLHIIESLTYFIDAEGEADPNMLIDIRWDEVKKYFLDIQKKLIMKFIEID